MSDPRRDSDPLVCKDAPPEPSGDTRDPWEARWAVLAEGDARGYQEKAREYGHVDLDVVGNALLQSIGADKFAHLDPAESAWVAREIGIAFYLLGKVARMCGAYADGRIPSNDTWHDTTVYSMMGRLNREGIYGNGRN